MYNQYATWCTQKLTYDIETSCYQIYTYAAGGMYKLVDTEYTRKLLQEVYKSFFQIYTHDY